jgi:hypothetical protein
MGNRRKVYQIFVRKPGEAIRFRRYRLEVEDYILREFRQIVF